jgi:hypothetical protein
MQAALKGLRYHYHSQLEGLLVAIRVSELRTRTSEASKDRRLAF